MRADTAALICSCLMKTKPGTALEIHGLESTITPEEMHEEFKKLVKEEGEYVGIYPDRVEVQLNGYGLLRILLPNAVDGSK
jgi:hypothetical protein